MSEQLYLKNYPVQHLSYKMRTLEANIRGSPPEYTLGKGVLEYVANLQENAHVEV